MYSQPKLYIPKDKHGKPTLDMPWHVWFNFRNPETGNFDSKSKWKYRSDINSYNTISQRKALGNRVVQIYAQLLEEGYNPFKKEVSNVFTLQKTEMSCRNALNMAFEQKKTELSSKTISDWKSRLNSFLTFADSARFADTNISEIISFHIASFLNHIASTE